MSYHGHFETPKPPKKKKGKKIALIILAIVLIALVAAAVFGVSAYKSVLSKVNYVEMPTETTLAPTTAVTEAAETTAETTTEATTVETTIPPMKPEDIINILVVGQSARGGEEGKLADTMILASVNTYTKTLTLTSFLRDAYVDIPDYKGKQCGWGKINSVYHLGWTWADTGGAMEMMNMCLKNNFGIEVDYNVEIDFNAFTKIIDILGGVRIDLTEAEVKYLSKEIWYQEFVVGENRLFGNAALEYARMRKADGDGDSDIKRTVRQRTLITALIKKLARKMSSEGLDVLQGLANEILPMITTNMTNEQITTCIWELLPLLPELTIETGTCPVETTYWGEMIELGGYPSSVLKFYPDQQKKLMMPITEGTTE